MFRLLPKPSNVLSIGSKTMSFQKQSRTNPQIAWKDYSTKYEIFIRWPKNLCCLKVTTCFSIVFLLLLLLYLVCCCSQIQSSLTTNCFQYSYYYSVYIAPDGDNTASNGKFFQRFTMFAWLWLLREKQVAMTAIAGTMLAKKFATSVP